MTPENTAVATARRRASRTREERDVALAGLPGGLVRAVLMLALVCGAPASPVLAAAQPGTMQIGSAQTGVAQTGTMQTSSVQASATAQPAAGKNTVNAPASGQRSGQAAGQTSAASGGQSGGQSAGQVMPTSGQPLAPTSSQPAAPLLGGSADQLGGYSGNVLEKVLRRFSPPANMRGIVRVLVRVGADGRPLSCDDASQASQRAAGNSFAVRPLREGQLSPDAAAEDALVDAACRAVALSGSFGPAPYSMPAEIFLTLAAGPLPPDSGSAYATQVMERVRPHIHLPIRLGGPFEATVRVKVSADGRFEALELVRSSGKAEVDAALVQAFAVPGVLPPPGQPRELELSFTLRGE